MITIRQETPADHAEIYSLIQTAFASAEHRDGNEQDLVNALRKSEAFIPELSLVAQLDGRIAGHILFTKARIVNTTQLALAPLSVLPAAVTFRRPSCQLLPLANHTSASSRRARRCFKISFDSR